MRVLQTILGDHQVVDLNALLTLNVPATMLVLMNAVKIHVQGHVVLMHAVMLLTIRLCVLVKQAILVIHSQAVIQFVSLEASSTCNSKINIYIYIYLL